MLEKNVILFGESAIAGAVIFAFFWPYPRVSHHATPLQDQKIGKGGPCDPTKCKDPKLLPFPFKDIRGNPIACHSITGDNMALAGSFVCTGDCGELQRCQKGTNKTILDVPIPPLQPHQTPINQAQRTANEDAKMLHGAVPNIFTNPIGALQTGVSRILQGQNVFTGDPVLGGARPLEAPIVG